MIEPTIRTERAERRQVAALCWRQGAQGLEILLVTSRESRRWVTPKGGRMPGHTDSQAAAAEALEEAGVEGVVTEHPIGTYRYLKWLRRGEGRWCVVSLYPLEVNVEHDTWQEQHERERRWMLAEQAAACVNEPDLADLFRKFSKTTVV